MAAPLTGGWCHGGFTIGAHMRLTEVPPVLPSVATHKFRCKCRVGLGPLGPQSLAPCPGPQQRTKPGTRLGDMKANPCSICQYKPCQWATSQANLVGSHNLSQSQQTVWRFTTINVVSTAARYKLSSTSSTSKSSNSRLSEMLNKLVLTVQILQTCRAGVRPNIGRIRWLGAREVCSCQPQTPTLIVGKPCSIKTTIPVSLCCYVETSHSCSDLKHFGTEIESSVRRRLLVRCTLGVTGMSSRFNFLSFCLQLFTMRSCCLQTHWCIPLVNILTCRLECLLYRYLLLGEVNGSQQYWWISSRCQCSDRIHVEEPC